MNEKRSQNESANLPGEMTRIFIGLLKKGPTWSAEETAQVTEHQHEHLELLGRLGSEGNLLIAGPTHDGSDLRGILVIRADTQEAARELFAEDPHIQSDRLILELHPWFVPSELLEKPLFR